MRGLVHRHHQEAPDEEDQRAEPDPLGDDERRPIAPDDEVGEGAQPADDQRHDRVQRRLGEQHPAAVAVDRLEEAADTLERLLARLEEPLEEGLRLLLGRGGPLDARQVAALAEVGEQAREPRRPGRAEALLGDPDQIGQRMRPVEQLEEVRVVVGQPQERVAVEVLEHPALGALAGFEALERVARAHPRLHPELRRRGLHAGRSERRHDEARAGPDHDRAARLGGCGAARRAATARRSGVSRRRGATSPR